MLKVQGSLYYYNCSAEEIRLYISCGLLPSLVAV